MERPPKPVKCWAAAALALLSMPIRPERDNE